MIKNKISERKKNAIEQITELCNKYPIIGVVNMENMPAPQLQKMRETLRGKVELRMTKKRLMKIAFEKIKKDNIKDIEKYFRGMPALLFTEENPFKIFKIIKKNKSTAPAKPGQVATNDIKVAAGPTPFAPGPVIGELGALGIKTGIENGKVAIKEDCVVVKEGETISAQCAGILSRLGIEPMEIGLDITAMYENGTIFEKSILSVDEQEYIDNISKAAAWAFNLSVEARYPTKDNVELMLYNAANDARNLAIETAIVSADTISSLIAKSERQMLSLKSEAKV